MAEPTPPSGSSIIREVVPPVVPQESAEGATSADRSFLRLLEANDMREEASRDLVERFKDISAMRQQVGSLFGDKLPLSTDHDDQIEDIVVERDEYGIARRRALQEPGKALSESDKRYVDNPDRIIEEVKIRDGELELPDGRRIRVRYRTERKIGENQAEDGSWTPVENNEHFSGRNIRYVDSISFESPDGNGTTVVVKPSAVGPGIISITPKDRIDYDLFSYAVDANSVTELTGFLTKEQSRKFRPKTDPVDTAHRLLKDFIEHPDQVKVVGAEDPAKSSPDGDKSPSEGASVVSNDQAEVGVGATVSDGGVASATTLAEIANSTAPLIQPGQGPQTT